MRILRESVDPRKVRVDLEPVQKARENIQSLPRAGTRDPHGMRGSTYSVYNQNQARENMHPS